MATDIDALVAALSLEEKANLTAGVDFWHTFAVPRLGIDAVILTDGPIGARGATEDHESVTPSVAIPSATALGATFDPELVRLASAVVARQAIDKGAKILLAPTVNLHRHPLWGRNFEAFSEDPLLTAKLGVAYIEGVQGEGIAATVKHFVANEAEHERYTTSSDLDERTLRELYLLPFEYAVRHAEVLAVMTSYNRVNGTHVPDDERLIPKVLREEWGFDGIVMTDWYGMAITEAAARSGLDLEMPGPGRAFGPALAEAVRAGAVEEKDVDAKVRRLLQLFDRLGALEHAGSPIDPPTDPVERPIDRPEDREFLRAVAAEAIVLLKNDGILPLARVGSVALIGPNAEHLSVVGGGSAKVRPHYELSLVEVLRAHLPEAEVTLHPATDEAGVAAAVDAAAAADVAIVVVGTDLAVESEGFDRTSMDLPHRQEALIAKVRGANPRTVVVVNSGAPVTMRFADKVPAVVQAFYGGQELANGIADVLCGDAEPGGRLPTTFPERLEHTPAFASFPGEASHTRYGEGLLIGYRWYEARHLPVRFAFGHGLSYTSFEIGSPRLVAARLARGEKLSVEVPVTNTGGRKGSEVIQCYVAPPDGGHAPVGGHFRPVKELKAFAKVHLDAGESTTVTLELGERAFAYYDPADSEWPALNARRPHWDAPAKATAHRSVAGWYVDGGTYELCIGRSSADIAHRLAIEVEGGDDPLDAKVLPD